MDHIVIQFNTAAREECRGQSTSEALRHLLGRLRLPAGGRLDETALARWLKSRPAHAPALPGGDTLDLSRFLYLHLPPGLSVDQCLARLRNHPLVDYAEADGIGTGGSIIPDDPNFSGQWYHHNTIKPGADNHITEAWDLTTGSSSVIVAVLDTGTTLGSTEFQGRLVAGYDFANNDSDPTDDHGHGTAVMGTVGATGNNGVLLAGVDWRCRLMPLKVLDASNSGLYSWWAQAVDFAVLNGAKVINLSAGGSGSSSALTRAIDDAIAHDVIFVTITHNDGTGVIRYPGNLPQSITLGSTDEQDRRSSFSNYGPQIDLVAPGSRISALSRTGGLSTWNGTSFSAPQAAGVCALLASFLPRLTQEQALAYLIAGADDQVGDANDVAGFDNYYGYGRLNARNTLLAAYTNTADLVLSQTVSAAPASLGCEIALTVTVANFGPQNAAGVTLSNLWPSSFALQTVVVSQGAVQQFGDVVVVELGDLPEGSYAQMVLTGLPALSGIWTNEASVIAVQDDPNLQDNQVLQEVTVVVDDQPPSLIEAVTLTSGQGIQLSFSENVTVETATNLTHYQVLDGFSNHVALHGITLGAPPHTLVLNFPALSTLGPFLVTVEGLTDCLGHVMEAVSASAPSLSDLDLDGVPDLWETLHDLNPDDPADAQLDTDGDSLSNREEFLAGTDPWNEFSVLKIESIRVLEEGVRLQFFAVSNKSYSVLVRDGLEDGPWLPLLEAFASVSNRVETVLDPMPTSSRRSYRLVTPKLP